MEEKYFFNYIEFGDHMYELAKEGNDVLAVATYDETIEIIKWLVSHDDVQIHNIEVYPYDWNHYDKEFYITITADLVVYVEPAYIKSNPNSDEYDKLLCPLANIIFFSGEANYKTVKGSCYDEAYEFVIGTKEDNLTDDCGDCSCDCSDCPKDKLNDKEFRVHTITISRKDVPSAWLDLWF